MIKFALKTDSIKSRTNLFFNGISFFRSNCMTSQETDLYTPNTYELEFPANFIQEPHFHINDEFQLVTQGSGAINSEILRVGSIIYTNRFTAYGPIQAGTDGMKLITIRMAAEEYGSKFMSEHADQIANHTQIKKVIQPIDRGDCSALNVVEVFKDLIEGVPGALTGVIRIPPNFEFNNIQETFPGDKFIFIKTGSFNDDGSIKLTQWDHIFLSSDETIFSIKTDSTGAELIIMQFTQ